ncbi:MAG: hypothetical protein ACLQBX_17050 [Candidatus Limnocylindrales bacterium]
MIAAKSGRVRAAQERAWVLHGRRLAARYGLPEDDARALAYWRACDAAERAAGRPLTVHECCAVASRVYRVDLDEVLAGAREVLAERSRPGTDRSAAHEIP